MIIVTGGAGFIGSNIVKQLNDAGRTDILVVDDLTQSDKYKNLMGLKFADYLDGEEFRRQVREGRLPYDNIETVFHQGACSDTMEYNGKYMMDVNFEYSKDLLRYAWQEKAAFIYASSASTYGSGKSGFTECPECEEALNVYAYSKLLFDRYVRRLLEQGAPIQIVGLRYFNVYGPQENHKGRMASIVYQMYQQILDHDYISLFEGTDGYGDGEQQRDFVFVDDVVRVNLFFRDNPAISGVFNCGTGKAHSFNEVARAVIAALGKGDIEYTAFPDVLRGKYQNYTQADVSALMAVGYDGGFTPLQTAVESYCRLLAEKDGYY